jgi:hypothetical protein
VGGVGLDFRSIRVPLDADPVRAIRADPALRATAEDYPPFGVRFGDEVLPEISEALLAVLPAGVRWSHHFGDRSFQQAEYLLDRRVTRTWEERERTMAYRTVFGDERFAGSWRCSDPAFLAGAAERIDTLDVAAARRGFSVAEMARNGVYKVQPGDPDDDAFARVLANLRSFADHCRDTAARELGLIITLF